MEGTKENRQKSGIVAKHNIKDCVFTNMFGDKKYLLQMYKALHPEDTKVGMDDLNIVTLENVLVNDLYNDLGFTVGDRLICLVEAQSTWTMNILIRVVLYYAKTLKEYLEENCIDLYTSAKASIPKPEFYVVFTGNRGDKPDTIKLSDEFFNGELIGMDVTIKMLYGEKNDIIGEYVTFTKVYNEQCKLYGRTKEAVEETIRICKDKNVLREYLESREKEVIDMMVTLFDEEQIRKAHDKTVLNQGIDIGINQGIDIGRSEGIQALIEDNFEDGKSKEVIIDKLIRRFQISREKAEEYLREYLMK